MRVLRALQDFVREFRAIHNHAITGRQPQRRDDHQSNRRSSYEVDGWFNTQFDVTHRVHRR
jgi:hypothetical protein